MRTCNKCGVGIALLSGVLGAGQLVSQTRPDLPTATRSSDSFLRKLPMSFEPNRGQTDSRVRFMSRGKGYQVFLADREAVLAFAPRRQPGTSVQAGAISANRLHLREQNQLPDEREANAIIRIRLAGDVRPAAIQGESILPGEMNYIPNSDPKDSIAHIETYQRVRYKGVYPGVDLVYYGNGGQLEYDFVVAPGADPKQIQMRIRGAESLHVSSEGNLVLNTSEGSINFNRPAVYQEIAGGRHPVSGTFRLLPDDSIGFALGKYDHSKPLVIDPVLAYSTYLSGGYFDAIEAIAVDNSGDSYVTGVSYSCDFPTTAGSFESTLPVCFFESQGDLFVSKLSPDGSSLIYSTYLTDGSFGPTGSGHAIVVDSSGEVYVAGQAGSGLPVTPGAFQTANRTAGAGGINGFVLKLNSSGSALIYSTYIGGSFGADSVLALAVDQIGDAYVAGTATSVDFPATPGAFQTTDTTPGEPYSFAAKLDPSGSTLLYSTYLVGTGKISGFSAPLGQANAIAIDNAGDAYVVGGTSDMTFPVTQGAFQTAYSTDPSDLALFRSTGYVAKLDPTGSRLLYSSYLGGVYMSQAQGVAVDSLANAYVTGWTTGGNVTTPGAFQTKSFGLDAYVVKVNPSGSLLSYATFLGGSCLDAPQLQGDTGFAIALDPAGDAYIAGETCSLDFPTTNNAIQTTLAGANPSYSAFLAELNPAGSNLVFSSYLGGSYTGDWALGVGLDEALNVYIAGLTHSTSFPTTTGALQTQSMASGQGAGFVAKFTIPKGGQVLSHDFSMSLSQRSATVSRGGSATTTLTVAPTNGFYELISFDCSGLPVWAQCNFSPPATNPGVNTSTVTLTITTAPDSNAGIQDASRPMYLVPSLAGLLWWFRGRRSRGARTLGFLMLLAIIPLAGCGGGSAGTGGGGGGGNSFTATIVGTATSAEHSVSFTMTAN